MATKVKEENMEFDSLTTVTEEKTSDYNGPMVDIFLPAMEEQGQGGMKVDQYEHVTIANERGEKCYKVLRGEHVSVPVPVFVVLKERYPKL